MSEQINNPLHGVTLQKVMEELLKHYSWEELNQKIKINCFYENPSIKSSLTFLRKTTWARQKVEDLYLSLENNK